jgi:hypothetical protein
VPRYDPHPPLAAATADCLRRLSDPELDPAYGLPSLDAEQAARLVHAARVHGTLGSVVRQGRERDPDVPLATALKSASEIVFVTVGRTMRLRHWGGRISAALGEAGVSHAVVKGAGFAERLYPIQSDRSYSDVDVVIRPDDVARASEVVAALGFVSNDIPDRSAEDHCEFKWVLEGPVPVSVELQTNLVHSMRLRQRLRLDLDAILEAGDGDPQDATALAFVAAAHASVGHQFERLNVLVDVMQAARERGGPIDAERLKRTAQRTGTLRAVAASFDLAGRTFEDAASAALSRQMMGRRQLESLLVSPGVVLKAQSETGRNVAWRRRLFRTLVYRRAPLLRDAAA